MWRRRNSGSVQDVTHLGFQNSILMMRLVSCWLKFQSVASFFFFRIRCALVSCLSHVSKRVIVVNCDGLMIKFNVNYTVEVREVYVITHVCPFVCLSTKNISKIGGLLWPKFCMYVVFQVMNELINFGISGHREVVCRVHTFELHGYRYTIGLE